MCVYVAFFNYFCCIKNAKIIKKKENNDHITHYTDEYLYARAGKERKKKKNKIQLITMNSNSLKAKHSNEKNSEREKNCCSQSAMKSPHEFSLNWKKTANEEWSKKSPKKSTKRRTEGNITESCVDFFVSVFVFVFFQTKPINNYWLI